MSLDLNLESSIALNSILDKYVNPKSQYQQLASNYAISAVHRIQKSLDDGKFLITDPIERSQSGNNKKVGHSTDNQQATERCKSHKKIDQKQQKKLFRKLMRQQVEIEERRNKNLQEMKRRNEMDEERIELERKQRMKSMIDQKRRMLEEKAKQRSQNQLKRQEELKISNQRLDKIKHQKHLFEVFEQNYQNQVLFPTLQEKKQKLKERRELSKPMSISELRTFEKQYLNRRQQMSTEINQKRNSLVLPKYQPPKKSANLLNILENELHIAQIKQQQKHKILNENKKRSQQYSNIVKQRFKPRPSQRSATPLVQNVTISREHRDEKLLGNDYLQFSKLKIKRNQSNSQLKSNVSSVNQTLQTKSKTSKFSNYLETRDNQYYDNLRQKKLNQIIQSKELSKHEKILQLNKQTQRLDEVIGRKNLLNRIKKQDSKEIDTTEALLASVRAKVGMLELIQS